MGSDDRSGITTCKIFTLAICAFVKLGVAITVLAIVGDQLYEINGWYWVDGYYVVYQAKCLMWDTPKDGDLCQYAYAVGALSILLTLLLLIFLCTPSCGGFCIWVELILHGFMLAWWIVAAIIFTEKAKPANDQGVPKESYRNGVAIVAWIAVLFSCFAVIACSIGAVACLATCCCPSFGRKEEDESRHEERKEERKEATAE